MELLLDRLKIPADWLIKNNINPDAFNYIEEFLFAIKYLQVSAKPYFPPYKSLGGQPDQDALRILIANVKDVKENIKPDKLKKFWDMFYDEEMDVSEIARRLNYSDAYFYKLKNIYRLRIVKIVEMATWLVPSDAFYIRKKEEMLSIKRIANR